MIRRPHHCSRPCTLLPVHAPRPPSPQNVCRSQKGEPNIAHEGPVWRSQLLRVSIAGILTITKGFPCSLFLVPSLGIKCCVIALDVPLMVLVWGQWMAANSIAQVEHGWCCCMHQRQQSMESICEAMQTCDPRC